MPLNKETISFLWNQESTKMLKEKKLLQIFSNIRSKCYQRNIIEGKYQKWILQKDKELTGK